MSRLQQAQDAVRPALKARVLLSGVAGAGKTLSSLEMLAVLAEGGPILVIDTEKESALTYADWFEERYGYKFQHLAWAPPFDPRELAALLLEAGQQYAAMSVDSLSHFWRKSGGTLDIADSKFSGWKVARPAQEDLLEAILTTKAHLIACVRSKIEYAQETAANGKQVVTKLGMAVQQDDTLEFEVNICGQLDIEHRMAITKSRCIELPVGKTFQPGHVTEMAQIYGAWLKGGEPLARQADIDELVAAFAGFVDEQARGMAKREFVQAFGRPEALRESRLEVARAWIAERVAALPAERVPVPATNGSRVGPDGGRAAAPGDPAAGPVEEPPAPPSGSPAQPEQAEPTPAKKAKAGAAKTTAPRDLTGAQKLRLHTQKVLPDLDDPARYALYGAVVRRPVGSGSELTDPEVLVVWQTVDDLVSGALELRYDEQGVPMVYAAERAS